MLCLSKAQLPVNKAYCYELIQHLGYREAAAFISQLLAILPAGGKLLVGGIPDEQRKWDFYNTQARREGLAKALIETGTIRWELGSRRAFSSISKHAFG